MSDELQMEKENDQKEQDVQPVPVPAVGEGSSGDTSILPIQTVTVQNTAGQTDSDKTTNDQNSTPKNTDNQTGTPKNTDNQTDSDKTTNDQNSTPKNTDNQTGTPKDTDNQTGTPKNTDNQTDATENADNQTGIPKDTDNQTGTPKDTDNQTGTPKSDTPQNSVQPVQDRANMDLVRTAMRASGRPRLKNIKTRTTPFHTMKQLLQMEERHKKKAKEEKKNENSGNEGDKKLDINTQDGLVNGLLDMRNSNIYKAVVLARELEGGGSNPLRSGRFSRFFKSSKYNKAADSMKLIGAANGALGVLDGAIGDGGFASSVVGKGITLVSNFMALITSIRDFVVKIKNFKKEKTKTGKVFSIIGMLTDIFTALGKGCAIAKTLAEYGGKTDGIFKNGALWDRITLLMNSASQIGGLLGAARGLHVTKYGISKLKALENIRWKGGNGGDGIQAIVAKYEQPQIVQEGGNNDVQTEDLQEEEEQEEDRQNMNRAPISGEGNLENDDNVNNANPNLTGAHGDEGEREAPARRRRLILRRRRNAQRAENAPEAGAAKKQKPQTATKTERTERRAAANRLLNKEEVSSEEKDRLASYVAIHRRIEKTQSSLTTTSTGLVAAAIGLGSSVAISVNNNTGSDSSKTAKTWMGFAASLGGIVATGTKMGLEKRNQKKQDSDEADAIQGRLWGTIEELKDDKYGLRGARKKADEATEEAELDEPRAVYKRYMAAQSQFEDSGVKYDQLFQVPDLRSFKKALISGI